MKEGNDDDLNKINFNIENLRGSLERTKIISTKQFKGRSKKQHKTSYQKRESDYSFERI